HPYPPTLVAPTGSKQRQDEIPAAGSDSQRDRVTVRAAIAFGQNEEEDDGRRDQTKKEEADEDDGKDDRVRHQDFSSARAAVPPEAKARRTPDRLRFVRSLLR